MIALDTNVIVRVVTKDDPEQFRAAVAVMAEPKLFASKTVLLETVWVLGFSYGLDRAAIERVLTGLAGYPNLTLEDRPAVLLALNWFREGMDFADALHLASGRDVEAFATFDRKLASAGALRAEAPAIRLLS